MTKQQTTTELCSQSLPLPPPNPGWRLAAAGSMSGMLTNTLLHPLDTVKTVRQTDPKSFKGLAPTLYAIVRQRGPAALYSGILPALVGSSFSTALYFGMYEFAKARVSRTFPRAWASTRTRVPLTALSAACGNVASSIIFVPKEVIKQRLQSGHHGAQVSTVIANLFATSGLRGFYRGYKATLFRNIPSAMIRFTAYEELKMAIRNLRTGDKSSPYAPHELILAGSMAGAMSSALTTPMDVVKTGFATGNIKPHTKLPIAIRDIVRNQGVSGLFIGARPRIVWSALFAAIGFTSYEICKAWLTGQPSPFQTRPVQQKNRVIVNQPRFHDKKQV